jgi:predicted nucleic acid-binding protein
MTILGTLGHIALPETIWDAVGEHLRILRGSGVTVPFPDAVIATAAISNNVELWTRDAHFTQMQRVLPLLRLFIEPP